MTKSRQAIWDLLNLLLCHSVGSVRLFSSLRVKYLIRAVMNIVRSFALLCGNVGLCTCRVNSRFYVSECEDAKVCLIT